MESPKLTGAVAHSNGATATIVRPVSVCGIEQVEALEVTPTGTVVARARAWSETGARRLLADKLARARAAEQSA